VNTTDTCVHPSERAPREPFAISQDWVRGRGANLAEVLTDKGLDGCDVPRHPRPRPPIRYRSFIAAIASPPPGRRGAARYHLDSFIRPICFS
jgi:hypothetical protein